MSEVVQPLLLSPIAGPVWVSIGSEAGHDRGIPIKVPEAATLLGVSRAKLYELIAAGTVPSVKVDGCRRLRIDDLRDYVEKLPIS